MVLKDSLNARHLQNTLCQVLINHILLFRQSHLSELNVHLYILEMDVFVKGKAIFTAEGCLGCHQARGVGGILGPDLTEQGEKTRHEYSFQNIEGEQTISNWLKEHFRDPEMVSPGSQVLTINLDEGEMEALATFVERRDGAMKVVVHPQPV